MALIFFDIDGTLWDGHMQIPESTIPTLKKLQTSGHKIFLCSGRSRASIQAKELMEVGFDGILAACGNHIELNNEIVYENILSPELTEKVIDILRECRMPVVLEGPDYMWIDEKGFEDDAYVVYLFQELGKSAQTLKGYTSAIRINKFSADILDDTDYEKIKEQLQDEFEFIEHVEKVVEFVPKGTSKATGIAWLCDYLGVDRADTYAVGDSVNDLDMLTYVGHGIAMGNASQPAKEAAEYVTTDIHEDGIMHAMEHYGLI